MISQSAINKREFILSAATVAISGSDIAKKLRRASKRARHATKLQSPKDAAEGSTTQMLKISMVQSVPPPSPNKTINNEVIYNAPTLSISKQGSNITVSWTGGVGPWQVQRKEGNGQWKAISYPLNVNTFTFPNDFAPVAEIRILQQPFKLFIHEGSPRLTWIPFEVPSN